MNLVRPVSSAGSGLLAEENAFAAFCDWRIRGERVALVTLTGIDGGAPRPLGAQMAVSESGRSAGYLSGGCLEQAIVLEALDALQKGECRMLRYGKGSPFFDVHLPCGSGLDVFIDVAVSAEIVAEASRLRSDRKAFVLVTDCAGPARTLETSAAAIDSGTQRDGARFSRLHTPDVRFVLFGGGPAVDGLSQMARAVGLPLEVWAADDATREALAHCGTSFDPSPAPPEHFFERMDAFTAVVLAFHEHDREPDLIQRVLSRPCFYIGVLGSMTVHRRRCELLEALGVSRADLGRLRAPIGAIAQAKGKATLAVGVLAEILSEAKARGYLA